VRTAVIPSNRLFLATWSSLLTVTVPSGEMQRSNRGQELTPNRGGETVNQALNEIIVRAVGESGVKFE
jgi:hypothetical protein